MMYLRSHASVIVGAIIAFALQILLAPNIAIFQAMPNFVAAYVLVVAIARPDREATLLAFLCGMLYNLIVGGTVGSLSLVLVVVAFLAVRAFRVLANDTLVMPLVVLVAASLVVECVLAVIVGVMGAGVSFGDAVVARALPCALYDCVVGLIMYPLVLRFVVRPAADQPPIAPTLG